MQVNGQPGVTPLVTRQPVLFEFEAPTPHRAAHLLGYLGGSVPRRNVQRRDRQRDVGSSDLLVNRYAIRWAPQAVAVNGVRPGENTLSVDPTKGPAYIVHCHILDHEDNEMMRSHIPVS